MVIDENAGLDIMGGGTVPLVENLAIPIETLPNLRRVDAAGKVYRSSRQDLLNEADSTSLSKLGIRSIIDFRSAEEYNCSKGEKLFDQNSNILEVIIPKTCQHGQPVCYIPVKPLRTKAEGAQQAIQSNPDNENSSSRNRYIINFFKTNYVLTVFNRIPLYKRLFSLLYLIFDVIFRTHFFLLFSILRQGGPQPCWPALQLH